LHKYLPIHAYDATQPNSWVVSQTLKGKDVLKVNVSYRDSVLTRRTGEHTVTYTELPLKPTQNDEEALLVSARQQIRCRVVRGVAAAALAVGRLDRASAIDTLRSTADDLRQIHDSVRACLRVRQNFARMRQKNYAGLCTMQLLSLAASRAMALPNPS